MVLINYGYYLFFPHVNVNVCTAVSCRKHHWSQFRARVLVPVAVAAEAAGRSSGLVLEESDEGG